MQMNITAQTEIRTIVIDQQPPGPELPEMKCVVEPEQWRSLIEATGLAYAPNFSGKFDGEKWLVTVQWTPIPRVTTVDILEPTMVVSESE